MTYKYTGFSTEEFYCLLRAFNIEPFIGLSPEKNPPDSQAEYDAGIFSLFKRELIKRSTQDDSLLPDPGIRESFNIIKSCEDIIYLSEEGGELLEYCIYIGEGVVITTTGSRKGEYLRLALIDREDFGRFLRDSGYTTPGYDVRAERLDIKNGESKGPIDINRLKEGL